MFFLKKTEHVFFQENTKPGYWSLNLKILKMKTETSNFYEMVDRIQWDTVSYLTFHRNYFFCLIFSILIEMVLSWTLYPIYHFIEIVSFVSFFEF